MNKELERREEQILGNGPRLQPLGVEALTDELWEMILRMSEINAAIASRQPEVLTDVLSHEPNDAGDSDARLASKLSDLPEIMRTMLRHPQLFARLADTGIQLLGRGALPARDRELVILRIGWLCRAPYEWGEHVLIAKKVGIASEDIEKITHGSSAAGWNEHEAALLRAAEELHADAMISDATWNVLSKTLDDRQLIELPVVIGQYQAAAYYQNSLRLRLHDGNLGLKAR